MNILNMLANDGFICVNKGIIKEIGLNEAVLLGELASVYNYNHSKGLLSDGWFYATNSKIENDTGLSPYVQKCSLERLEKLGFVQLKTQGISNKRHIKLNCTELFSFMAGNYDLPEVPNQEEELYQNSQSGFQNLGKQFVKIHKAVSKNSQSYIYNNTINNNTDNNTPLGESNKNINNFSENNNQIEFNQPGLTPPPEPPKISKPVIMNRETLPKDVRDKLVDWNKNPTTKQALIDYCLFLKDNYGFEKNRLKNAIDQVKMLAAGNCKGIEIICSYSINRNYARPFKPSDYAKLLTTQDVVSSCETQQEFCTDENGNIEEIW